MVILTNCLSRTADEGCIKVANSLINRIKKTQPETVIVSYERASDISNEHLKLNKFLFSIRLFRFLKKHKQPLLYIPFPSKTVSMAVRVLVLSLFTYEKINVVLSMNGRFNLLSEIILKLCRANFYVLSHDAYGNCKKVVGSSRCHMLKTGIDTERFVPVDKEKSDFLKHKYGLDKNKPVILHAGHMKKGRNLSELLKISPEYQILLLTSTLTKDEQDSELKKRLSERNNIRIIDEFIPDVEEIYQLSDVYFFPVVEEGNCIDVPLSCLEAASCNKPIVTTDFGEMKSFKDKNGFWFIGSFEEKNINSLINEALNSKNVETRSAITDYDWNKSVGYLISNI